MDLPYQSVRTSVRLYLTRPRMTHFGDSGKRQILGAFRLSVTYFRAIHSVVPHSVVSLRRMKWTTEWGQPNGQNSRKHFRTKTGCKRTPADPSFAVA